MKGKHEGFKAGCLKLIQEPRAALHALCEDLDVEPEDRSDAKNLFDVLGSFEFILGMVIWHDILFVVNKVSKKL